LLVEAAVETAVEGSGEQPVGRSPITKKRRELSVETMIEEDDD
jgi:hypothetical protein